MIKLIYISIILMKGEYSMSQIEKVLLKMKQQPNGIKFDEAAKVLEANGYTMKKAKRNIT